MGSGDQASVRPYSLRPDTRHDNADQPVKQSLIEKRPPRMIHIARFAHVLHLLVGKELGVRLTPIKGSRGRSDFRRACQKQGPVIPCARSLSTLTSMRRVLGAHVRKIKVTQTSCTMIPFPGQAPYQRRGEPTLEEGTYLVRYSSLCYTRLFIVHMQWSATHLSLFDVAAANIEMRTYTSCTYR